MPSDRDNASPPRTQPSPSLELMGCFNELLFHASTIYFALISGLLYSLVPHTRGRRQFFAG